jgi:hypothetical protein
MQEFGWFKGQPKPTMTWNKISGGSPLAKCLLQALVHKLALVAARFGYRLELITIGVSVIHRPRVSVSQENSAVSVICKPEVKAK